jgi:hypothetical protein
MNRLDMVEKHFCEMVLDEKNSDRRKLAIGQRDFFSLMKNILDENPENISANVGALFEGVAVVLGFLRAITREGVEAEITDKLEDSIFLNQVLFTGLFEIEANEPCPDFEAMLSKLQQNKGRWR